MAFAQGFVGGVQAGSRLVDIRRQKEADELAKEQGKAVQQILQGYGDNEQKLIQDKQAGLTAMQKATAVAKLPKGAVKQAQSEELFGWLDAQELNAPASFRALIGREDPKMSMPAMSAINAKVIDDGLGMEGIKQILGDPEQGPAAVNQATRAGIRAGSKKQQRKTQQQRKVEVAQARVQRLDQTISQLSAVGGESAKTAISALEKQRAGMQKELDSLQGLNKDFATKDTLGALQERKRRIQNSIPTAEPEERQRLQTELADTNRLIASKGKEKSGTTVNVNMEDNAFLKELGKKSAQNFVEKFDAAQDARDSLIESSEAIGLLDEGIISGFGANYLLGAQKFLFQAGLIDSDTAAATEAYQASQAKQVAKIIKAFGAGTGLSDADREYAEKAAAGKITMTEESLRRIIDINNRAATNVIKRWNKRASKIPQNKLPLGQSFVIDIPTVKSAVSEKEDFGDMSDEDIEKLKALRKKQGG